MPDDLFDQAIADLRAKAARLGAETVPNGIWGDGSDGSEPRRLLAIAWIEEVNAIWDQRREGATGDDRRACDLAIEICREKNDGSYGSERDIVYRHPPIYHRIFTRDAHNFDPWMDKCAVSVQQMMAQAVPLWVCYYDLARARVAAEKANG